MGMIGNTPALGLIRGDNIEDGSIDTADLKNSAVTPAKLSASAQYMSFKNRIINGAMMIDQRNAGASVTQTTSNTLYSLDRWKIYGAVTSKFTVQQTPSATETGYATRVAAGFNNYLAATSSAATTVGSTDTYVIAQAIEGFNMADLAWGTANAKTVTLSFWAYSSLTGTFGGSITNSAQNYSYPFSYSIPVANTWTQISITVSGPTSGTWLSTNGAGLWLWFGMGIGSTYLGTSGSWAGAAYYSATGATNVVATNGATFYITGVQLEKGSTATEFDRRPYGTELFLCQRYFVKEIESSARYSAIYAGSVLPRSYYMYVQLPVTMRAPPTVATTELDLHKPNVRYDAITSKDITVYDSKRSFFVGYGVATADANSHVAQPRDFSYTASAEL